MAESLKVLSIRMDSTRTHVVEATHTHTHRQAAVERKISFLDDQDPSKKVVAIVCKHTQRKHRYTRFNHWVEPHREVMPVQCTRN